MDNQKIGKLISELRNKKGLTQQELGDKIGVGFRAVSKWECGQTLPDISNMKELSKIFDITLDELLSGKLKSKNNKISNKVKTILVISSIIILVLTTFFFLPKEDKTYVYNLSSVDKERYKIDGQITFTDENISIVINELKFHDDKVSSTEITNYEYQLISNDRPLFGYGYSTKAINEENLSTIEKFSENFVITFTIESNITRSDIIENSMYLIINFVDENNQIINQTIEITLSPVK